MSEDIKYLYINLYKDMEDWIIILWSKVVIGKIICSYCQRDG